MRQAVPLLCPQAPLLKQIRKKSSTDSRVLINAEGTEL